MRDDTSGTNGRVERHTTGEDRVRMVARQLSEPRTANWIATEAGWSHGPTKRVLERLLDDGWLHRDEGGRHTTYVPDYRRQAIAEAMRLRDSDHTVHDLTARLSEMKARIREWKEEFGVKSPHQLRATIVDEELAPGDEAHRREIARNWDHLQRRIRIVQFTIREWDFLSLDGSAAAVS